MFFVTPPPEWQVRAAIRAKPMRALWFVVVVATWPVSVPICGAVQFLASMTRIPIIIRFVDRYWSIISLAFLRTSPPPVEKSQLSMGEADSGAMDEFITRTIGEISRLGSDLNIYELVRQMYYRRCFLELFCVCEQEEPSLAVRIRAYVRDYDTHDTADDGFKHYIESMQFALCIIGCPRDVHESRMLKFANAEWDDGQCEALCHLFRHYPDHAPKIYSELFALCEKSGNRKKCETLKALKCAIMGTSDEVGEVLSKAGSLWCSLRAMPPALIIRAWRAGRRPLSSLGLDAINRIFQGLSVPEAVLQFSELSSDIGAEVFDRLIGDFGPPWAATILIKLASDKELTKNIFQKLDPIRLFALALFVKRLSNGELTQFFPYDRNMAHDPLCGEPNIKDVLMCMAGMSVNEAVEFLRRGSDALSVVMRKIYDLVQEPVPELFCEIFWLLLFHGIISLNEFNALAGPTDNAWRCNKSSFSVGGRYIFQSIVRRGKVSDVDLAKFFCENEFPFEVNRLLALLPPARAENIRRLMAERARRKP
jgi:hypothetical protein